MVLVDYTFEKCCVCIGIFVHPYINTSVYSYGLLIFLIYVLLVNFSMYFDLKYVFHTDLQTPVLTQIGKIVLNKVY
jgi:hypothetical protein